MDIDRRSLLLGGGLLAVLAAGALLPATCAVRQLRRKTSMDVGVMPQRPAGKAKPLLDEDIAPVLARLETWYSGHLPADRYVFNPPAEEAAIDAFERAVGLNMPSSYRQLYRWHDGEEDDRWGHIYGLPLLPLRRAAAEWRQWQRTLRDLGGNPYAIPGAGWPAGAVDPAYVNPGWIPLTSDGSGGHIGLDLAPWPSGRVGQVILFGRDDDVKVVLAESLGQFLAWIAGLLESGNFRLTARSGERVLRPFGLKEPPTNDFHEGARVLLGAPGPYV